MKSEQSQAGLSSGETGIEAIGDFGIGNNRRNGSPFAESLARIRHIVRKEFIQIVRSRQNFPILIIAPIFQLLLFGFAVRTDVREVPTVVADMDRSALSRQLVDGFSRSGYFVIRAHLSSYHDADAYLEEGLASVALLIPPDLERTVKGFRTAKVGVLIDGIDTTLANTVSAYSNAIIGMQSQDLLETRVGWARGLRYANTQPDIVIPGIDHQSRAWFNPNLDSKYFFVPGVLALILTFLGITVPAMSIVREKELGTIEQIMVTPTSSTELVLGKTIPAFVIAIATLMEMTVLAFLVFDPIFRGTMLFFFFTSTLYMFTCIALGVTISAFCVTQQQAILTSFMVLQPAVLLSGFAFPIENMPEVIQYITYANPLRYFVVIVREVFLKGAGWALLWPQVIPICAMGIFFIALASALFKKKID